MRLNPATQYVDDRNLSARQRLWQQQDPPFDLMNWVLDLAGVAPGERVLEVGCGNGRYLEALRNRGARAAGCDLSPGILRAAGHPALLNADVTALPVRDGAVDLVLACHLLDLVPDRATAIRELGRVLAPGGRCVAVTNGAQHIRALRDLVEQAVGRSNPELAAAGLRWCVHGRERSRSAGRGLRRRDPGAARPGAPGDHPRRRGGRGLRGQHRRPLPGRGRPAVGRRGRGRPRSGAGRHQRPGRVHDPGDVAAFVCE